MSQPVDQQEGLCFSVLFSFFLFKNLITVTDLIVKFFFFSEDSHTLWGPNHFKGARLKKNHLALETGPPGILLNEVQLRA